MMNKKVLFSTVLMTSIWSLDCIAITGTYPGSNSGYGVTNNLGHYYRNSLTPILSSSLGSWNNLTFNDPTNSFFNSYGNSNAYGSVAAGYSVGSNSVYNNTLNFQSGQANRIFAGFNDDKGNVFYNTVNMTGGVVERIYGGWTNNGNAFNNIINMSNGETKYYSFAGRSSKGNAYNNTFNLSGGTVGKIAGGRSETGEVYNNTVNVTGGTITDDLAGARSNRTAYLHDNVVNIEGGNFTKSSYTFIAGAWSSNGISENNSVNLKSNTAIFSDDVVIFGGTTDTGTAKSNTVRIETNIDLASNLVAGGHSNNSGSVTNNAVYINTMPVSDDKTKIYGGQSSSGNVSGNIVAIPTSVTGIYNGTIAGGNSNSSSVSSNMVIVSGGEYSGTAKLFAGQSSSGSVSGNTISINGGIFQSGSQTAGGYSLSGDVSNNNVFINSGEFKSGSIVAASINNGNSYDNNTITIKDPTTSSGLIFESGAIIASTIVYNNAAPSGTNTVVLNGGSFNKNIIGAVDINGNEVKSHYANSKLNVMQPTTVDAVSNVKYINLFVRNHDTPSVDPMLEAKTIDFGDGAVIKAYVGSYGDELNPGDTFNLFQQTSGGDFSGTVSNASAIQGVSLIGELEYDPSNGNLEVMGISAHPHARTFPEARLASFSFINQTDDLMLGQGVASALEATRMFPDNKWRTFAAFDLGESHYNTDEGSTGDVSYSGVSMVTGASKRLAYDTGKLMLAGYFETGFASTEVDNNNNDLGSVSTSGNISFYGAGFMSRYDYSNGLYLSGIVRAGMIYNKFDTNDEYTRFDYNNNTPYYGAGANIGYQFDVFDGRDGIDVYTRYMWTHLASQDEEFDNQTYNFDAINSHQLRIGGQYNFMPKEYVSYVIGVAGQYEFDGESKSDVNGLAITSPNIKGLTGMLELGLRIRHKDLPNFTSSFSLEGFIGARDGASATLDITYSF